MIPGQIAALSNEARLAGILLLALLVVVAVSAAADAGLLATPSVQRHRRIMRGVNTTVLNQLDRDIAAFPGSIPAEVRRAHRAAHRAHQATRRRMTGRQIDKSLAAAFAACDAYEAFAGQPATTEPPHLAPPRPPMRSRARPITVPHVPHRPALSPESKK